VSRRGSCATFDAPDVYRRTFRADPAVVEACRQRRAAREALARSSAWESCGAAAVAAHEAEEAA
jgi:hypothetical protein